MKNILILLLLLISNTAFSQNLYLIFDPTEPIVTKDVRKYLRRTNAVIKGCGVFKLNDGSYSFGYPWYGGIGLELEKKDGTTPVSMTVAQSQSLYPNAMNAAQFDLHMQPIINQQYVLTPPFPKPSNTATALYLKQFQKIFVIEYLGNGQAKVVEARISSAF